MAHTPPPVDRARTPPTPLHGPMFDSPRRSSRIHNKQKHSPGNLLDSPTQATVSRKRSSGHPTYHQALSPPSSPVSPDQRASLAKRNSARPTTSSTTGLNTTRSGLVEASKTYPTPSKTPRKIVSQADFGNTARALFHDRGTIPEEIMSTPTKPKKGKKHIAFSLDSFEEERLNDKKVQIYTDSKERVPEVSETEDNPFIVKKSAAKSQTNGNGSADTVKRGRGRPKHGMGKKVDEAVENDKGMVYTFRGKKIFRKFKDESDGDAIDDDDPSAVCNDQDLLRRHAGPASRKRLTRSSIKPRLLFPPKEDEPTTEAQNDVSEEATTDIETPPNAQDDLDASQNTPKNPSFGIGTPPATEDKKRSPFDSWPRTKPGRGAGRAKRPGSPLEKSRSTTEKRGKSAQPAP